MKLRRIEALFMAVAITVSTMNIEQLTVHASNNNDILLPDNGESILVEDKSQNIILSSEDGETLTEGINEENSLIDIETIEESTDYVQPENENSSSEMTSDKDDSIENISKDTEEVQTYLNEYNYIEGLVEGDYVYSTYDVLDHTYAIITEYKGQGGNVVIPSKLGGNDLKRIQSYAFSENKSITTVSVPEGVTEIGSYAFGDCGKMTSITLPSTLETLGVEVFRDTALYSITIPAKLSEIGFDCFNGCNNLKEVLFEEGITEIPSNLLSNAASIEKIIIPSTVVRIGNSAFYGCTGLTSVEMQEGVESIGDSAFSGCIKLPDIVIPEGVTEIAGYAFSDCSKLASVSLPSTLKSIGYCSFRETAIYEITIPAALTEVGADCFAGCENLKKILFEEGITQIPSDLLYNATSIEEITIPNTVRIIGDSAFYNCTGLKSIIIPESVTEIGNSAFSMCTGMTNVIINKGVKKIGGSAFSNCEGLTSVEMQEGVESIGDSAFSGCTKLPGIVIPEGVTEIAGYAFDDCPKLTSVSLPSTLKSIGYCSFRETAIYEITIPAALTEVGADCFAGCENLKKILFEEGITQIPSDLLYNATSIEEITIPNTVRIIGDSAFYNCTGLKSIIIPESVTEIGNAAFFGCSNMTKALIPSSVRKIGYDAFESSEKVSIYASRVSYAAIYAIEHKIPLVLIGDESVERRVMKPINTYYYMRKNGSLRAYISYEISNEYRNSISDKRVEVRIPSDTTLNESTIRYNGELCQNYIYEDNNLVINAEENKATIVFDLNRTSTKTINSYAVLYFTEDGSEKYEIIDVVGDIFEGVTIDVDSTVTKSSFDINGLAPGGATVHIYVDGVEQGSTVASKGGYYDYEIKLSSPRNEQIYEISAMCTYEEREYEAKTYTVYSGNIPHITSFKLFYNNNSDEGVDLLDDSVTPYISFAPDVPFTFTIDFDHVEEIDRVFVTSTRSNIKHSIEAKYDANTKHYIARGYFDDSDHNYVPGTIRAEYQLKQGEVYVQESIPEFYQAQLNNLSDHLKSDKATIIRQEDDHQEYELNISNSIAKENSDYKDVILDYSIDKYNPQTDGSINSWLNMSEADFNSNKSEIKGSDGRIYYVVMDYSVNSKQTMIVKDSSQNIYRRYRISYFRGGQSRDINEIIPYMGLVLKRAGLSDIYAKNLRDYESRNLQISESFYIKDKAEAERKNRNLFRAQNGLMAMMFIYAMIPSVIGITAPLSIGFSSLIAFIGVTQMWLWSMRIVDIMGRPSLVKWAIDPSGYVYSQVISNRIEGVKITALFKEKETDTTETIWDASEYKQLNPLFTDADGNYAWDVPEGFWSVRAEADGYRTAMTDWMEVPPPRTDVAIRLIPTSAPVLLGLSASKNYAQLSFDQYMNPDTVKNIKLVDADNKEIAYDLEYDKSECDENGNIYARNYILKFIGYTLQEEKNITAHVFTTVKSADGISASETEMDSIKEIQVTIEKEYVIKSGSLGEVSFTVKNYNNKSQITTISDEAYVATADGVKVGSDGKGVITIKSGIPGETYIRLLDNTQNEVGILKVTVLGSDQEKPDPTFVKGDVTGDGDVAMGDVLKVAKAVAGVITLTDEEKKAADVTGDDDVAMGDVLKIARYVAGDIDEL